MWQMFLSPDIPPLERWPHSGTVFADSLGAKVGHHCLVCFLGRVPRRSRWSLVETGQ